MWLVGKALDAGETGGEESDKASLGKLELNFRNGGGAGEFREVFVYAKMEKV